MSEVYRNLAAVGSTQRRVVFVFHGLIWFFVLMKTYNIRRYLHVMSHLISIE